jgi:4-amino-4-deoxy-L-arabinose transferase-like glycosyltransferase
MSASQRLVSLPGLLALIALFSLYRYWVLSTHGFTLYIDEAYYWTWAQALEWGYFSKPPVIAGIIALTTGVCGDGEVCVRIGSVLIHPLSALLLYALGRRLFDPAVGFWAATAYLTMPAVAMSSLIISTDVALLLFWSLALYAFWRALESGGSGWWLVAALALGLGLMSKYTMLLFGLSALLYLLSTPQQRGWWRDWRPWAATVLAFALLAPNIWWNLEHDFPTLRHTAHISHLEQGRLHPDEMAGFFFSQFAVFGPVLFAVLLWLGLRMRGLWRNSAYRFLLLFSLPFLTLICLQALLGRAHANWAAPAYAGGVVLVTGWLYLNGRRRLLIAGILVNLLLGSTLYHLESVADAAGMQLTRKTDPYLRLRGWRELAREVAGLAGDEPDLIYLSDSRTLLSHLAYQLRLPRGRLASWNPDSAIRHQFDISHPLTPDPGKQYLMVSEHRLPPGYFNGSFQRLGPTQRISVPLLEGVDREVWVYRLSGFLGYRNTRGGTP